MFKVLCMHAAAGRIQSQMDGRKESKWVRGVSERASGRDREGTVLNTLSVKSLSWNYNDI